jgi:ketosteroid isomerase-like protein
VRSYDGYMRLLILLAFLPAVFAQSSGDLFQTISHLDTELFDAYNKCDIDKFASLLADDLEFYHDVTGLSVGKKATVDAVKENICGKVHRDLVPGTLKVYPLNGYGAVGSGIHLFCNPKSGACPDGSGVGRFLMLWENKGGVWKITRVVSYDHCNGCSLANAPPDFRK